MPAHSSRVPAFGARGGGLEWSLGAQLGGGGDGGGFAGREDGGKRVYKPGDRDGQQDHQDGNDRRAAHAQRGGEQRPGPAAGQQAGRQPDQQGHGGQRRRLPSDQQPQLATQKGQCPQ